MGSTCRRNGAAAYGSTARVGRPTVKSNVVRTTASDSRSHCVVWLENDTHRLVLTEELLFTSTHDRKRVEDVLCVGTNEAVEMQIEARGLRGRGARVPPQGACGTRRSRSGR